jgi:hypothetical protein
METWQIILVVVIAIVLGVLLYIRNKQNSG